MQKLDLKKTYSQLYKALLNKPVFVTVPPLQYLVVDGHGDPNHSQLFQDATAALFSLAYTIKFMVKKGSQAVDYGVMPLEGLWWADDMRLFSAEDKSNWKWSIMIMQPPFITQQTVTEAKALAAQKKQLPQLENIRLETMEEGLCAQVLHIGPYSAEGPTIENLHRFIKDNGYTLSGKHREIYIGDVRRSAPEKLKTIIRQPITK